MHVSVQNRADYSPYHAKGGGCGGVVAWGPEDSARDNELEQGTGLDCEPLALPLRGRRRSQPPPLPPTGLRTSGCVGGWGRTAACSTSSLLGKLPVLPRGLLFI